jgi:hypothetical protein
MDLLYARWHMGLSLAFHIIFAVIGLAMPVMMVAAEVAWLHTKRPEYFTKWSRESVPTVRPPSSKPGVSGSGPSS